MKTKQIKMSAIAIFAVSLFAVLIFNTNKDFQVKAAGDAAADYKAKCAMCHSPKAEKSFDPSKSVEVLTNTILKGNPTAKPPMPGYEAKGMTAEQAKGLAEYMVSLRKPADANTNTTANVNANANATSPSPTPTPEPAKFNDATMATYKAKCSMCHTPKAEKAFDATKADDVLVNTVLKGNATSKPPMPGYEAKGMKADEATSLVAYMKSLRK